jgi:hypothetical protein
MWQLLQWWSALCTLHCGGEQQGTCLTALLLALVQLDVKRPCPAMLQLSTTLTSAQSCCCLYLQAVAAVRAAYLASHLTKLRPFIAPGVAEAIERTAAGAPAGALQLPEPPSSPPEQLKAVLRDYQVRPRLRCLDDA